MKEGSSLRFTIYQNIIKENQDKVAEMIPKNVIHEGLERCEGIGEAEGHD